jgi:hypothetical protein
LPRRIQKHLSGFDIGRKELLITPDYSNFGSQMHNGIHASEPLFALFRRREVIKILVHSRDPAWLPLDYNALVTRLRDLAHYR